MSRITTTGLLALALLASGTAAAQSASVQGLPDAPSAVLLSDNGTAATLDLDPMRALLEESSSETGRVDPQDAANGPQDKKRAAQQAVDANGKPIPLERQQPQRILGFMPNFRTVSAGAAVHPPGWKYNFTVATRQATDYSSFIFLGLTSVSAEGINSHPVLGKGVGGFYAYTWRGFLDKTDGTYLGAWLLPSLLHEDTRYYPLGPGHPVIVRSLYVISRQGVARTYGGRQTPNIAGLGAKVLTQIVSREYYPTGATDFSVLATKFAYAAMRDIAFSSIREFYPDIAAHYIRQHRAKVVAAAARDTSSVSARPQP